MAERDEFDVRRRQLQLGELIDELGFHRHARAHLGDFQALLHVRDGVGKASIPDQIAVGMADEVAGIDQNACLTVKAVIVGKHADIGEVRTTAIHGVELHGGRGGCWC